MKIPEGYSEEIIENYLLGKLEETAKVKLEADILQNPDLETYIKSHKQLFAGIQSYQLQQIKKQIQQEAQQLKQEGFFIQDEQIEDYLLGNLPNETSITIERWRQENPDLEDRIQQQHELLHGIKHVGEQRLQKNIQNSKKELEEENFFTQESNNKTSSRKLLYRWSLVAAVISVLFFAGRFLLWPVGQDAAAERLPLLALEEQLSSNIARELSEQGFAASPNKNLEKLAQGLEFYQQEHYTMAIPLFKAYIEEQPMSDFLPEVQLYLAIAYLAQAEQKKAIPLLLNIHTDPPQNISATAIEWYLAKAYWENQEQDKAKPILERLATEPSIYQKTAQMLLD